MLAGSPSCFVSLRLLEPQAVKGDYCLGKKKAMGLMRLI
jgi:hypothetical protein